MGSRHMGYPSPRGVHVPETYASDDHDPYRPPRRNRYSRSVHQTPRIRDVTWISSPEVTPQTSHGPPTPWLAPSQVPSSPAYRPPPSPAPTVGEHMAVDDAAFMEYEVVDPYRPQRQRSGKGLFKSFWNGLKKLSGYQPVTYFPRPSSYESQTMEMPVPRMSAPSEGTEYVNPTPPGTEEQQGATPYTSPYVRPTNLVGSVGGGSMRASPMPVPSMDIPLPTSGRGSPMPVPSVDTSPYVRPTNLGATPAVLLSSLRASPVPMPSVDTSPYVRPTNFSGTPAVLSGSLRKSPAPVPSIDFAPAITVVSPSISPSPHPSPTRSVRVPGMSRNLSVGGSAPSAGSAPSSVEECSQTLHEPVYPDPVLPPLNTQLPSALVRPADELKFPTAHKAVAFDEPSSPQGSLASTIARFRRYLDDLPWVSDTQIADEYVPDQNPRSRMRKRVRQGAEPSWYNPRPEVVERPAYLSEWDMWAMQSTAMLWDGMGGRAPGGAMYPHGYAGFVYPPRNRIDPPVVP